jgi:hypothetical protein
MKSMFPICLIGVVGTALVVADEPPVAPPAPAPAPVAVAPATNVAGPKIQFQTPVYDFGKAKVGDPIKHTFIFTNIGNQTLELSNVRPGCGCTAAGEWTRKVEPGQTGSIPIQMNSASLNGHVMKTVTVDSNDKTQPSAVLQIKGTVWKPVEVNPQFAVLNVPADSPFGASTVVRIVNNLEEPLVLGPPQISNPAFTAELKTNQPGKEYELIVSAGSGLSPGNIQGQISLKTSSTNMPIITVTAWANVQPAIMVMPQQVTLQPAPLPNKVTPAITIQNNSTNTLTLSEPVISGQDVDIQLREVAPGRTFTATMTFPQGFEIPTGQQVEFTVKSSHPKFPVIKVPIVQMARPNPPPPVPVKGPPAPATLTPLRAGAASQ